MARLDEERRGAAKALAWLRANYMKPFRLDELASIARMGVSTLNHHFRAVTALSPLQYQRQLRLMAARERMLVEGLDATEAALEVEYESTSQFHARIRIPSVNRRCATSKPCDRPTPLRERSLAAMLVSTW